MQVTHCLATLGVLTDTLATGMIAQSKLQGIGRYLTYMQRNTKSSRFHARGLTRTEPSEFAFALQFQKINAVYGAFGELVLNASLERTWQAKRSGTSKNAAKEYQDSTR